MHGRLGRRPGKFTVRQLILLEGSGVGNVARVIAISRLADNDTQYAVSKKKPITLRDTRKLNNHEFVDNGVDDGDYDDDDDVMIMIWDIISIRMKIFTEPSTCDALTLRYFPDFTWLNKIKKKLKMQVVSLIALNTDEQTFVRKL